MSQYPFPYSPPPSGTEHLQYYSPPADPLGPAKRASILMFILGGMFMACGTCALGLVALPWDQVPPEQMQALDQLEIQLGIPAKTAFIILGVIALTPGILFLSLGFFVRRGGKGASITATILTGLILVYLVYELIIALMNPGMMQGNGAGGLCLSGLMIGLFTLLMVWLIQAIKASSRVKMMQDQYQAQYWQHQQQQQAYGYGYPPQEPNSPAPPPPLQPPADPNRPL